MAHLYAPKNKQSRLLLFLGLVWPYSGEVEAFEVRSYRAGDAPRVVSLLMAAFGDWPGRRVAAHARPEEFFRWKHERNPHGPSYIALAEVDGRLAAMRAYMPWPLLADGGRRVSAVHTVDLATHPDFRGQGISSKLSRAAIELLSETRSFAFGLPNDMSTSQSLRVGWQPVGRLRVWVRVRRPLRVIHRARSLKSPGRSLAVPSVEALSAADCFVDGDGLTELLRDSRVDGARLATDADVDYLRWRYEPLLGDYRAVTEHEAGRLVGLAIFALRQRGELWEGSVCELFVRPGDTRTAGKLLRQITAAAPLDYLAAVPPAGSALSRTLSRAGFFPSLIGGRSLGVTPYHDGLAPDPRRRDSWSLSFGDLERLDLC
jgi:GNAT superfamily N-acetyltransferase